MRKYGTGKILRDEEEEKERKEAAKNFTKADREALLREIEDDDTDDKSEDERSSE